MTVRLSPIAGRLSGLGLPALALLAALHAAPQASAEEQAAQLAHGQAIFAEHCAHCHGAEGEGGAGYANSIVGGRSLAKFGNAKRLYDYNRMMMPFDDPSRLASEEKWDVTAYLLHLSELLPEEAGALDADNAADIPIAAP